MVRSNECSSSVDAPLTAQWTLRLGLEFERIPSNSCPILSLCFSVLFFFNSIRTVYFLSCDPVVLSPECICITTCFVVCFDVSVVY